jgi:hypothetical protein
MIKKNLDLIIVGFVMISIFMYEVTLEVLEEAAHLLFELLHTAFEWVELGVDQVVEHMFHELHIGEAIAYLFITERHGSQVITFYILMSAIGYGLFKLSKTFPGLYQFLKRAFLMSWIRRKTQFHLYWRSLTQLHKAFLVATALGVTLFASLFII